MVAGKLFRTMEGLGRLARYEMLCSVGRRAGVLFELLNRRPVSTIGTRFDTFGSSHT